jgi:hypothetical protein
MTSATSPTTVYCRRQRQHRFPTVDRFCLAIVELAWSAVLAGYCGRRQTALPPSLMPPRCFGRQCATERTQFPVGDVYSTKRPSLSPVTVVVRRPYITPTPQRFQSQVFTVCRIHTTKVHIKWLMKRFTVWSKVYFCGNRYVHNLVQLIMHFIGWV